MSFETIAEYPGILPLPQSNFSGGHITPTQTTTFTSGRRRRRKIGRTSVKTVTLEWLFTPEEYDLFEAWHRLELNDGTVQFQLEMCSGGTLQTGNHVVQFVEDPSFSHEECNWRVSVPCVIFPYPRGDEYDVLKGFLGAPIQDFEDLLSLLNRYYDRNFKHEQ